MLQLFDFNQPSISRKFFPHKKHNDGIEAPRNSLEFPIEGSESYHIMTYEDIPYSLQVKPQSSKMNPFPTEAPMRKLIDEDISNKAYTTHSAPGVVARLMGMDTLPSEKKASVSSAESIDEKLKMMGMDTLPSERKASVSSAESVDEKLKNIMPANVSTLVSSTHRKSQSSTSFDQMKEALFDYDVNLDSCQPSNSPRTRRPQPRKHPQEELLQKFKREFEARQASKLQELSRSLKLDANIRQVNDNQIIAQKNLNKEKMAIYVDAKRISVHEKAVESRDHLSLNEQKIPSLQQGAGFQHELPTNKRCPSSLKDDMRFRGRGKPSSTKHLSISNFDEKQGTASSPTRIVVLKPTPESDYTQDSWFGAYATTEKDSSMEEFLQEVKERIRLEIQGKAKGITTERGSVTEISFSERSTDPKHIAYQMAKQIRETVSRDLGTTLMRSESTKSCRSEIQFNEMESSEFMRRDTRKVLSERLKNVLKNEVDVQKPQGRNGWSGAAVMVKEGWRGKQTELPKMGKRVSHWEEKRSATESKTRSLRHEHEISVAFENEELSPGNLIRSFSAPVIGTAFGKLLLEDQHLLAGAHIRRKHEASEQSSLEVRKTKKDGFNLKGKVSNLKQNISLKGKLFRKKIKSVDKSDASELEPLKHMDTVPSVILNLGIVQDNYTEVPPSPASVCSSSVEDFSKPGHPSPVSPLEAPFIEDPHSSQVCAEFSSDFPELVNLSEHVDNCVSNEVAIEEKPYEDETSEEATEIEDQTKGYVSDILLAARLFEGNEFNRNFLQLDAQTKPIPKWVFEEVEETYNRNEREDNTEGLKCCCEETDVGHRMLFDLINEALPKALTFQVPRSSLKKWFLGPLEVPRGKKLLDNLWQQIQTYINSPVDESDSLDSMMTSDLKAQADVNLMGREMELLILGELIDEFVCDMFC